MHRLSFIEKLSICLVVVAIAIATLARFVGLAANPPGFYLDEASIAINAWSITQSGVDEHGEFLPVYFKAFGEYKNPLYIYSQSLIFWLTGYSVFSSRLTSALWGILFVAVFGFLSYKLSKSKKIGLLAVLLALTNPWHFLLSRVVFEVISLPAVLIVALLFLYQYSNFKKSYWWYGYCLSLGLMFYSYTAARFLAPVFLVLAALIWVKELKSHLIGGVSLFGISLIPAFVWERMNPGSLMYAFHRVAGGGLDDPITLIKESVLRYFVHFSPEFLLLSGDGFLRHTLGFHSGMLWVSLPLVVIGIFFVLKSLRHNKFYLFLSIGFLLSPVPSAVTVQAPHALRSISLLVFILIFMAIGGWQIVKRLGSLGFLAIAALIVFESIFVYFYFRTEYLQASPIWFNVELVELFQKAHTYPPPYSLSSVFDNESFVIWTHTKYETPTFFESVSDLKSTLDYKKPETYDFNPGTNIFGTYECLNQNLIESERVVFTNDQGCIITR